MSRNKLFTVHIQLQQQQSTQLTAKLKQTPFLFYNIKIRSMFLKNQKSAVK